MKNKKVIFFFMSFIIFASIIAFIMIISIPNNPISLRYKLHLNKNINALLPEGWAFFTRDCKEEQMYVYKIENNKLMKAISFKTSDSNQLFGINRHNRIMHSKLGSILSSVNDSYYYKDTISLKAVNLKNVNEVNVKISNSKVCGKYLLQLQRPTPWTWFSSNIKAPLSTYRLVIVNFNCDGIRSE